jgi:energy-coupling factor transporter ATP-binding protein EcfA2
MRLTPEPPAIADTAGFTTENDLFGFREFGERLANLVSNIDQPIILALDGPWGCGKSTFVRQWAGLLRQRKVPVIVLDAFANDYHEDAFIPLASEIAALAQATAPQDTGLLARYFENAKKAGRVLLPFMSRTAIRVATAGVLSAEELETTSGEIKEAVKGLADDSGALAEKLIDEQLKHAQANRDALQTFRNGLRVCFGSHEARASRRTSSIIEAA